MERIAQAFGTWVPGDSEWQVELPDDIEEGDHLALFAVAYSNSGLGLVHPDGWSTEVDVPDTDASGFFHALCITKAADGTEGGTTIGWSGLGAGSLGGIVIVFRGGVLPLAVRHASATKINLVTAATTHTADATWQTQPSDRRVLVWRVPVISGTFTPPGSAADLGEHDDAETDIRTGAVEYSLVALGSAGNLAATTSANKDSAIASFAVRARGVLAPADLLFDTSPGAIGLIGAG